MPREPREAQGAATSLGGWGRLCHPSPALRGGFGRCLGVKPCDTALLWGCSQGAAPSFILEECHSLPNEVFLKPGTNVMAVAVPGPCTSCALLFWAGFWAPPCSCGPGECQNHAAGSTWAAGWQLLRSGTSLPRVLAIFPRAQARRTPSAHGVGRRPLFPPVPVSQRCLPTLTATRRPSCRG